MGCVLTISCHLLTGIQPRENTVTLSWKSLMLALNIRTDTIGQRKVHMANGREAM